MLFLSPFYNPMEINKDKPNEKKKGYLCRASHSQDVSHHYMHLEKTHRQDSVRQLCNTIKGRPQVCPDWRLFICESSRQTNQKCTSLRDWQGCIFGILWLIPSWKQGQKLGKLSGINQVQTIWGLLFQGLLFGLLDCSQRQWSDFL